MYGDPLVSGLLIGLENSSSMRVYIQSVLSLPSDILCPGLKYQSRMNFWLHCWKVMDGMSGMGHEVIFSSILRGVELTKLIKLSYRYQCCAHDYCMYNQSMTWSWCSTSHNCMSDRSFISQTKCNQGGNSMWMWAIEELSRVGLYSVNPGYHFCANWMKFSDMTDSMEISNPQLSNVLTDLNFWTAFLPI